MEAIRVHDVLCSDIPQLVFDANRSSTREARFSA